MISSDAAILQAKKENVVGSDGKSYSYTSGMITSGRNKWDTTPAKFAFTYGYIEVRAKVPSGQGLWPALWLLPFNDEDPGKWPPEIDIMEVLGDDPTTVHMHYHYLNASGSHTDSGENYQGVNFANDYHTYAVSWEPGAIKWFIDGVERRTAFTDSAFIPNEPMYFIANLAVGGDWPGAPDSSTVFPSNFLIDYVRIWQKAPEATNTLVPTAIATATPTTQPTATVTPTRVPTATPTSIPTATPTRKPTPTPTRKPTPTPTPVDRTPPVVSIYQPTNNAKVTRNTNTPIYANASDASGIQKIDFYVNGTLTCSDATPSPYSCIWRVPSKKNTSYTLSARAYDTRGNSTFSASVKVSVK